MFKNIPGKRIHNIVTIKFIAPAIDETPARCKLKIAKSTAIPLCAILPLRGGYRVQPVPTPPKTVDKIKREKAGGKSQKDRLFRRGKAISGDPISNGTNQFPKPPIKTGITKKNIITNACAVTTTL